MASGGTRAHVNTFILLSTWKGFYRHQGPRTAARGIKCHKSLMYNAVHTYFIYIMMDDMRRHSTTVFPQVERVQKNRWKREDCYWHIDVILACLLHLSRLCIQHCHSVCHCVCLCLSCKWTVAPFLCRHPLYLSPSHTLLLHWPLSLVGAKAHSCIREGKHLI